MTNAEREARNLELVHVAQSGDREARDELIRINWGLVSSIADKYRAPNLEFGDFFQEGYLGMERAIRNFREGYGATFGTYARYWIEQEIRRAIKNQSSFIRVPCYLYRKAGSLPPPQYKSFQKYAEAATRAKKVAFIPIDSGDYFEQDCDPDHEAISDRIEDILSLLTPDESEVLMSRYVDGEKPTSIARRFRKHSSWVFKTTRRAIDKVRAARDATT